MFKRILSKLSILIFLALGLHARQVLLNPTTASVDVPAGWNLYDKTDPGRISFINPDNTIIFQVTSYDGSLYSGDLQMMDSHLQELEIMESDYSRFLYEDRSVSLAEATFVSSGSPFHGWFLFIEREDQDYYLTAFSSEEYYDDSFSWIISCLDSFAPDQEGREISGPISTMVSSGNNIRESLSIEFSGKIFPFSYDPVKEESVQILIEREASILNSYTDPEEFEEAWKRYYQFIYRTSQKDLESLSWKMDSLMNGKSDSEKAELVLSWLQSFKYGSSDTFSDLLSPLSSIAQKTGDCDALALVYNIILHDLGIDALLMVSYVYSHAMAAVQLDRSGAGFEFNKKKYIVAELTKKVDIGMISQDMADISKWIIISPDKGNGTTLSIKE